MTDEQLRSAASSAADRPERHFARGRPLLLAAALAAETLWLAALAAMAWHSIAR